MLCKHYERTCEQFQLHQLFYAMLTLYPTHFIIISGVMYRKHFSAWSYSTASNMRAAGTALSIGPRHKPRQEIYISLDRNSGIERSAS